VLRVIEKDKRLADSKRTHLYDKMIEVLRSHDIIRDEQLLARAAMRPVFLSHSRKWAYTTIFAIVGEEGELANCRLELLKLGIERVDNHPSINFLN
jgi:hypothetical protein